VSRILFVSNPYPFSKLIRFFALLCMAGACFGLAACGSFGGGAKNAMRNDVKPQLVAEADDTDLKIADAAERATRALEGLSAVEQARTPSAAAAAPAVTNAPFELQRAVTFSWSGPVEPVAQDLANRAGYKFQTLGDQPPAPIIVTLDVFNKPMIEVMRDIGLQMGTRADLKLDANRHTVEIIYSPTVNRPSKNSSLSEKGQTFGNGIDFNGIGGGNGGSNSSSGRNNPERGS
jgi:defect-in-organelle-trafficking protein DotD